MMDFIIYAPIANPSNKLYGFLESSEIFRTIIYFPRKVDKLDKIANEKNWQIIR